jgi:UDP-hydrolysing UDP-N-acetyl-D-glucosamine 2-epimerase
VVVSGDRYELLAVLAVAVPVRIPIAHISGGDCTFGAMDEQIRHAVTKAAHLHFVANEPFAQRVRCMGEEPWRVRVTGDPGLDRIQRADFASVEELETLLKISLRTGCVLVAFHPVTNDPASTWVEWDAITQALENFEGPIVVTGCNADPQGTELNVKLSAWGTGEANRRFASHLGQRNFLGLLRAGACLLGNSSAGIWEAPSLGAPAVNLGFRQEGRLRAANVIDVPKADAAQVKAAIQKALSPAFREEIRGIPNPYGDGASALRIADGLCALPPAAELLRKRFTDVVPCN